MKKMVNKKGFTLVEMVTVVAIISLIAGATFFSVKSYLSQAQEAARLAAQNNSAQEQARRQVAQPLMINNILDLNAKPDTSGTGNTQNALLPGGNNGNNGNNGHTNNGNANGLNNGNANGVGTGNGNGGGNGVTGGTGSSNNGTTNEAAPEITPVPADMGQLSEVFSNTLATGNNTVGKAIVSNRPFDVNAIMREAGITNSDISISNCKNDQYVRNILTNAGVTLGQNDQVKIVSVTTDGTLLSEHARNDSVQVRQYLYYQQRGSLVCYGYRDVTVTVGGTDKDGRVGVSLDRSDADGSSWTRVQ